MNSRYVAGLASLLALSAPAMAQDNPVASSKVASPSYSPDQWVAGAKIGIYNVETVDLVLGYGAFADYALGNNFLVGGVLDYWNKTSAPVDTYAVQISDLALGAEGKFVFTNVKASFRPYALAGATVHRFSVQTGETTGDRIEKIKNAGERAVGKFGIDLGGGVLYRAADQVDVSGEVRYRKLADSAVMLDQMAFTGGVSYAL